MGHPDAGPRSDLDRLGALSSLEGRTLPRADLAAVESERLALESELAESGARLHLEFARHPSDPGCRAGFLHWVRQVDTPWQQVRERLDRAFLATSATRTDLPAWLVRLREVRERPPKGPDPGREPERLELLALLGELSIELGPPIGSVPEAIARGELVSPDRAWRFQVWQAVEAGWARVAPELDGLYSRLALPTCRPGATEAPPMTPQPTAGAAPDPDTLCAWVARHLVPLLEHSRRDQARRLGLDCLRPWDLACGHGTGNLLLPWRDTAGLVATAAACLDTVDPRAGELLRTLQQENLLDLEARPGKAPGAFCQTLETTGLSVIFANGTHSAGDLQTLVHEAGHAWQARLCHTLPALDLRQLPGETAEFAALGMEQLCLEAVAGLWGPPRAARAWRRRRLLETLERVARGCLYHCFEECVHRDPAGREARDTVFARLHAQFLAPGVDWNGWEPARARSWQRVPGFYLQPGEALGIARAQLAALQLGRLRHEQGSAVITHWNTALALGNSRDPGQVLRQAGCALPDTEGGFRELMEYIRGELERT